MRQPPAGIRVDGFVEEDHGLGKDGGFLDLPAEELRSLDLIEWEKDIITVGG